MQIINIGVPKGCHDMNFIFKWIGRMWDAVVFQDCSPSWKIWAVDPTHRDGLNILWELYFHGWLEISNESSQGQ